MIIGPEKIRLRVRERLLAAYSDNFKFYYSKAINEILRESRGPALAQFRDLLLSHSSTEELRRYYTLSEVDVRLRNYTAYYSANFGDVLPWMPLHPHRHFLHKNLKRKAKFKLRRAEEKNQRLNPGEEDLKDKFLIRGEILKKLQEKTVYITKVGGNDSGVSESKSVNLTFYAGKGQKATDKIIAGEVYDVYDEDDHSFVSQILDENNGKASKDRIAEKVLPNTSILTYISDFECLNQSDIHSKAASAKPEIDHEILRLRADLACLPIEERLPPPSTNFTKKYREDVDFPYLAFSQARNQGSKRDDSSLRLEKTKVKINTIKVNRPSEPKPAPKTHTPSYQAVEDPKRLLSHRGQPPLSKNMLLIASSELGTAKPSKNFPLFFNARRNEGKQSGLQNFKRQFVGGSLGPKSTNEHFHTKKSLIPRVASMKIGLGLQRSSTFSSVKKLSLEASPVHSRPLLRLGRERDVQFEEYQHSWTRELKKGGVSLRGSVNQMMKSRSKEALGGKNGHAKSITIKLYKPSSESKSKSKKILNFN